MVYLWTATLAVGVTLEALLVASLLRGAYRRFRVLFVYCLILLLTTSVEASAFYNPAIYNRTTLYYWVIDAARQALLFLLVISLVYQAMGASERRDSFRRALVLGALACVLVSLFVTREQRIGIWMTQLSRDLGFIAVILNLILWAVLLKSGSPDRTLLMVSGGMGIQMAGKAIGHSLRYLSRATIFAGDLLIVVTHLLCLYVWWQAFRRYRAA